MLMLTRRSCLLFPPCRYGCLSWQIPSGKEEQAGFLLPAFNASVVTESSACGLAVMLPLGRLVSDVPVLQNAILYTVAIWHARIL